jgi:hypothetical protein
VGENFRDVALGFDWIPDLFDFAVGTDQETAADDPFKKAAHEFFPAPRAVGFDHFVRGIAEQWEIELPLVAEFLQGLQSIRAGSEYEHTELIELLFCVAKLGRFDRSTGSIRLRKKEEQDAAAFEVFQRKRLAAVGGECEFGSFVADFEHEIVLLEL